MNLSALNPFAKREPMLSEAVQADMVEAIRKAEARTTGEVRVFVERHCSYMDPMDRAREIFAKLEMYKTKRRNAVLVYLAVKDQQFALFGDEEIYKRAGGEVFWASAASLLRDYLKGGDTSGGLGVCIGALGDALAEHFPYDSSVDKNELPDEIVFGK